MMRSVSRVVAALLVICVAFFGVPEVVVHAKTPPTSVTCTLDGSYFIDRTTAVDTLIPGVTASGDCDTANCSFTFSSRIGDIGDWFAVCQGSTQCDAFTTITATADITGPYTDEPQVTSLCSTSPVADAVCFTSGTGGKGCPNKSVDCFAGVDPSCSATRKLGGGIKGAFLCILNLPEPGLDVPDGQTVYVRATCTLS